MTAEEYLTRYKQMAARVKMLRAEIERLRTEAESMSINLDGMPRGSSISDKTARLAIEIAERMTALEAEASVVFTESMKIVDMIGRVENPKQQALLYKRYIQDKKWGEIAVEMRYAYQWVAGPLHDRALKAFEEVMKENERV